DQFESAQTESVECHHHVGGEGGELVELGRVGEHRAAIGLDAARQHRLGREQRDPAILPRTASDQRAQVAHRPQPASAAPPTASEAGGEREARVLGERGGPPPPASANEEWRERWICVVRDRAVPPPTASANEEWRQRWVCVVSGRDVPPPTASANKEWGRC